MSQFEAKVKATLDLSSINSDLQKIANKPIVLNNVKIGNVDFSALQAQANKAGQAVGRGVAQGTQKAMANLQGLDKALNTKKFAADISTLKAQFEKVANSGHKLVDGFQENDSIIQKNIASLEQLKFELEQMRGNATPEELASKFNEYNTVLATTKNQIKTVTGEMKQFASATQLVTTQNKMTAFLQSGTKAAQKYKTEVKGLIDEIKKLQANGQVRASDLQRISDQFKTYEQAARINGQNSLTFGTKLKNAFGKLANYVGASTMIYGSIRTIKNGINEVVELDNALVDLKKTSNATKQELDDFYFTANDSAKKFGTSTKDIIQGAADWSRLGYNLKDSQTMSEVSSIFKSISPGMTIDMANDGLISVMKAYKIEASDALDEVASKINKIGKQLPKRIAIYGKPKRFLADNYIG